MRRVEKESGKERARGRECLQVPSENCCAYKRSWLISNHIEISVVIVCIPLISTAVVTVCCIMLIIAIAYFT